MAVDVLEQLVAERTIEAFLDWQQRRKGWPQAWREHTGLGESSVYLTQAELAEIDEAFDALLMRYIDQRPIDDVASRPEGSVPVTFTLFTLPGRQPPGPAGADMRATWRILAGRRDPGYLSRFVGIVPVLAVQGAGYVVAGLVMLAWLKDGADPPAPADDRGEAAGHGELTLVAADEGFRPLP